MNEGCGRLFRNKYGYKFICGKPLYSEKYNCSIIALCDECKKEKKK